MFIRITSIISLSSFNPLVFVMEAEFVLCEVGTEFLNIIDISWWYAHRKFKTKI
jgi:hypothetical protein